MNFFKRLLCFIGIHWEGHTGLGMYGDASKCTTCGKDRYDLLVLFDVDGKDHKRDWSDLQFALEKWLDKIAIFSAITVLLIVLFKLVRHMPR
jgi:hypothetical protein